MDDSELNPYVPYDKFQEANPYQSPTAAPEHVGHDMLTRVDEHLNPWFSIWTKPRATTRQILDTDPNRMIWTLAALSGMGQVFQNACGDGLNSWASVLIAVAVSVLIGPIVGILMLLLTAFLIRHTGNWIGGVGDFVAIRAAIAWSYVPAIWALLLWVPVFAVYGTQPFDSVFGVNDPKFAFLVVVFGFGIVIGIWNFVIIFKCIGEAHQFSAWRGLGAFILAVMVMIGVILAIVFGIMAVVAIISAIA